MVNVVGFRVPVWGDQKEVQKAGLQRRELENGRPAKRGRLSVSSHGEKGSNLDARSDGAPNRSSRHGAQAQLFSRINNSPRQLAQRTMFEGITKAAMQRLADEESAPLQGKIGPPVQAKLSTTSGVLEGVHRQGVRGFLSKIFSGETTFDGIIVLLKQYESHARDVERHHNGDFYKYAKGGLADKENARAHQEDIAKLEEAGEKVLAEIEKWFNQPSRKGQEEKDREKIGKLRDLTNEIRAELEQIRNKRQQEEDAARALHETESTTRTAEGDDEGSPRQLSFSELADSAKDGVSAASRSAWDAAEKAEKAYRHSKKAPTAASAEKFASEAENQSVLAEKFAREARDAESKFVDIAKKANKARDSLAVPYIQRSSDDVRQFAQNALDYFKSAQNFAHLAEMSVKGKRAAEARMR